MKSPWRKRLLWTGLTFTLLIALALALVWFKSTAILNLASNHWLQKNGFEDSHLEIESADWKHLAIAEADVSGPGWEIRLEDLRVDYELPHLWETKQAERARLRSVEVNLDPEKFDKPDPDKSSFNIDPAWFDFMPKEGVEVENYRINLLVDSNTFTAKGNARLTPNEGRSLDADLNLAMDDLQIHLHGTLEPKFPLAFTVDARTGDPLRLIESIIPDWRTRFKIPDDLELEVGGLSADVQVAMESLETINTTTRINIDSLAASQGNRNARLANTEVNLETREFDHITGTLEVALEEANVKALRIGPQTLGLRFSSDDLKKWTLSTLQALTWDYDEGTATGDSGFTGTIETADSFTLTGEASTSRLSLAGLEIAPSIATIHFANDVLGFKISDLSPAEYSSVRLTDGTGEVVLNEDETIDIRFLAKLAANALESIVPLSTLAPINIISATTIYGESIEVKVDLESLESEMLFSIPGQVSAAGTLKTGIEGTRPLDGQKWTGKLASEISEMKIEGDAWSANEGSFFSALTFTDLDQKVYLRDQRAMIDHLLNSISGSLELSANQLTAGPVTAQWTYGLLDFGKEKDIDRFRANLTATAGNLIAAGETLNQVNAEISTQGNPDKLETSGTVGFLYQGIETSLAFTQTTLAALTSPTLSGEYILQPMRFDYSDAIARQIPAVADLSFSGIISANGTYRYSAENMDATLELRYQNGSADLPSSKLTATGIEGTVKLDSILNLTGQPGTSAIQIQHILLGDLELENTEIQFTPLNWTAISLEKARTSMFEGEIYATPATVHLEPLAAASALHFDHISLNALTKMISIFKGSMEGSVSGKIPLAFEDGRFQAGEGSLRLSDGSKARLQYDSSGLFSRPVPDQASAKPTLSDRVLDMLKLQPESVVENVLSDLTIHELSIDLLPTDTPLTPIRIRFSGEGTSGQTKVPLTLDTNVNGTLNELFDFLLQINSLGSPVLQ